MNKLSQQDKDFMRLILRSPDIGDGWRQAAPAVYRLVVKGFPHPDLIELDDTNLRLRLSDRGRTVAEYLS